MITWLKRLFQTSYLVQIDSAVPQINKSADESIKTLQFHPGFIEVHNRLRYQRALLQTKLETGRNTHEDDIWLKSGIFWAKFYHAEVDRLVNKREVPKALATTDDVQAEFDRVNSQFERVR
jgi:hypothetical protein